MVVNSDTPVLSRRYRLQEELGRGGMGVVYRAYDRLLDEPVALKTVSNLLPIFDVDSTESTDFRVRLAHEFRIVASLRHAHIISVIDYGFDQTQKPFFTMQLLDDATPLLEHARSQPLSRRVELIVQVFQALLYLHRNRVLHLDLKPENVLVVNQQVKVVDFGIAAHRGSLPEGENVSGTLTYMAPEVILGEVPSPATDLYSVGVMMYEMLKGRHPFDTSNMSSLIQDVLYTNPDTDLDELFSLSPVLEKLLHKEPGDRYQDAYDVIQDIIQATGWTFQSDTATLRESFLQSASFVGRHEEVKKLLSAVEQASQENGSCWLIGGESGVGKSRLIGEIHIHALVRGGVLLRGQAIRDGGNAYQLWRDVLRRLCLSIDLDDAEASVLKPLVPDIESLLDRPVADAPELNGNAAQERLFNTLEDILSRQSIPIILLLEDIHWSDAISIQLLQHLLRMTTRQMILIVATYRNDEQPDFAENFAEAEHLRLPRLNDQEISDLCTAILGENGRREDLLALLKRETDGNAYFMVEILRALAEEAGQLDHIATMALPERIIAGGIDAIVIRRLQHVPEYARPTLQLAAAMGRNLDLSILRAAQPGVDVEKCLTDSAHANVLEVEEGKWRFSQGRLRDGLLAELAPSALRALHQQIVSAIQSIYGEDYNQPAAMAWHLEMAGEIAQAGQWYARAGQQAEAMYAPEAAIGHYEKALSYLPDTSTTQSERIRIYNGLGKMLRWQAHYDRASEIYAEMRTLAEKSQDDINLTRAHIGISDVQNSLGKREEALESARQAQATAEKTGEDGKADLVEAVGNVAWLLYRTRQFAEAETVAQRALSLAQESNLPSQTARSLNTLSIVNFMLGHSSEATDYMERALNITRGLGDKRDLGIKLNNLGEFKRLGGDYPAALPYYGEALGIFREIGYREAELALLTNMGNVHSQMGQHTEGEKYLREAIELGSGSDWWGIGEAREHLADSLEGQHRITEAMSILIEAIGHARKTSATGTLPRLWRKLGDLAMNSFEFPLIDEVSYPPDQCYSSGYEIATTEKDQAEQAAIARAWGRYLFYNDEQEAGLARWREARDLYRQQGDEATADAMGDFPQL